MKRRPQLIEVHYLGRVVAANKEGAIDKAMKNSGSSPRAASG